MLLQNNPTSDQANKLRSKRIKGPRYCISIAGRRATFSADAGQMLALVVRRGATQSHDTVVSSLFVMRASRYNGGQRSSQTPHTCSRSARSEAALPNAAVAAKKARRASATLNSSRLTSSAVTYTRIKLLSL